MLLYAHRDCTAMTGVSNHQDSDAWTKLRPQRLPQNIVVQLKVIEQYRLIFEISFILFAPVRLLEPVAGEREEKNVSFLEFSSGITYFVNDVQIRCVRSYEPVRLKTFELGDFLHLPSVVLATLEGCGIREVRANFVNAHVKRYSSRHIYLLRNQRVRSTDMHGVRVEPRSGIGSRNTRL